MIKVFIEYKVGPEHREAYQSMHESIRQRMQALVNIHNYKIYEGLEQPGLIVEMLDVETTADFQAIRRQRTEEMAIDSYIIGGVSKVHIWAFQEISI
jgi:L-rhamnose mutarotase